MKGGERKNRTEDGKEEKRSMIVFITLPRVKYFNSQARECNGIERRSNRTDRPTD